MWKQLNQDEVRQGNMGTGSTREPGGQCSKHRVDRERGRDREWWWMKEREREREREEEWREQAEPWPPKHAQSFQFRNKLTNLSWHTPWQPHLFQLFIFIFRFQTVVSIHPDWRDNYATLVWIRLMFTHSPLSVTSLTEDVTFVSVNLGSSWVNGYSGIKKKKHYLNTLKYMLTCYI